MEPMEPVPLATDAGLANAAAGVTELAASSGTGGGVIGMVDALVAGCAGWDACEGCELMATAGASVVLAGSAVRMGAPGTTSVLLQLGHVM